MSNKTVPAAIQTKIELLKQIETDLGLLPPDNLSVNDLHKRTMDPQYRETRSVLQAKTEVLFAEICEDMDERGFSSGDIAAAVNAVLKYEGGPRYCSAEEVEEALS